MVQGKFKSGARKVLAPLLFREGKTLPFFPSPLLRFKKGI